MAESLTARVARLEAEVSSLKGCLIGIHNEAVSAMAFELLNTDGVPVAELNTTEDGEPFFALLDKNGQARLVVQLGNGRPQFLLHDEDGNVRLTLGEDLNSNLGLVITGRYRRDHVLLGFGSNGQPCLQIAGTEGAIDLDTRFGHLGWLGLSLADQSKKNRLTVALDPSDHNGKPFIVLTDYGGQQRWWRGG